jgi:hypothetical protein
MDFHNNFLNHIYYLQITTFLTTELTPKFAFRVLSCVFFFIMLLIYYISFHINIKTVS